MTKKLYLSNQNLTTVDATIVDVKNNDFPIIELDQTCFHPQGGGQKGDRGTIDGISVIDVKHAQNGQVEHYLELPNPTDQFRVGQSVTIAIDEQWRKLNARLHTAGHLIAALVEEHFPNLQATKAHHWPQEARVEFAGSLPESEEVWKFLPQALEDAIEADLPVPITGNPEQDRGIAIGNYPSIPCGGTHVESLSVLKKVELTKVKVKKDRLRISYDVKPE